MKNTIGVRVYGSGSFDAEIALVFLERFIAAYDGLLLIESLSDQVAKGNVASIGVNLAKSYSRKNDRLQVKSVEFHSPGFWEFIGKLNPLETIRCYLNDRHERNKDNSYRSQIEQRKLELESNIQELELIDKFILTCRNAKIPEHEITGFVK